MNHVFLSYRHESAAHRARVLEFGKLLNSTGMHVLLDQFFLAENPGGPDEGWTAWSTSQAKQSEKILIIGSPGWYRCYEGTEVPDSGLGSAAEGRVIAQRIYNKAGLNRIARLVVLIPLTRRAFPLTYHCFRAAIDLDHIVEWIRGTVPAVPVPIYPEVGPRFYQSWIGNLQTANRYAKPLRGCLPPTRRIAFSWFPARAEPARATLPVTCSALH